MGSSVGLGLHTGDIAVKQIIDGKVYNTDTAQMLFDWDNSYYMNDFNYLFEKLFRTRKGTYFLYCHGGALTYCRTRVGNGSTAGKLIRVLSKEDAFLWCQDRLINPDLVAEHFEVTEG